MTDRPTTTLEGALYDLVARGKKDTFFIRDEETSLNIFDARYELGPIFIPELRTIVPRNRVQWGGVCEFEIEKSGDILIEPTLLINLPTWLPAVEAAQNNSTEIYDINAFRYGYVNGIAYFLFDKIQFYQDNILLQEYSGDSLFAQRHMRGSYNSAFLEDALTGVHDGSPLSIQHAATGGPYRLRIPLPFCQHTNEGGLPLCATEKQQYRLRLTLRRLEDLVECSDGGQKGKPNPWDKQLTIRYANMDVKTFQTIQRYMMADPTIFLENKQLYIDPVNQKALEIQTATFSRLYENKFTFGPADYAPLATGATAIAKRLIEGRHPAEQMYWFIRSREDLDANRLWKFSPNATDSTAPYYNNIKLTVAGKNREEFWSSLIWQDIESHAKQERYSGRSIGSMNWSYGEQHAYRGPREFSPTGTLNFTSADRPTIYVDLAQVNSSNTQMNLIVDGYGTYSVGEGRGSLLYAN